MQLIRLNVQPKTCSGSKNTYKPYPWFWSDQYDVKLQIAGLNRGFDKVIVRPGVREGTVSHWYFKNDQFIAVDAMNDPRSYMVGKKLLESGKLRFTGSDCRSDARIKIPALSVRPGLIQFSILRPMLQKLWLRLICYLGHLVRSSQPGWLDQHICQA